MISRLIIAKRNLDENNWKKTKHENRTTLSVVVVLVFFGVAIQFLFLFLASRTENNFASSFVRPVKTHRFTKKKCFSKGYSPLFFLL